MNNKSRLILREAVSVMAAVYLLLLGPETALCEVCFTWNANTDTLTRGYNIYVRILGVQDWGDPYTINGVGTTLACIDLPEGSYEATITAWGGGDYYVDPVTSKESGYFTPYIPFTVDPETCQVPIGFRLQE